jgi:hypothetical protein
MEDKLTKIFQEARYEADPAFARAVWNSILAKNSQTAKLKLWAFAFAGFASLAGLAPAVRILAHDLAQSGFYKYSSLLFGSGGSVFSFWKELMFSLAESFPVTSAILTLSLVFAFFFSLRHLMKQVGNPNRLAQHQLSF